MYAHSVNSLFKRHIIVSNAIIEISAPHVYSCIIHYSNELELT